MLLFGNQQLRHPPEVRLHSDFDRNTGRQITKFYAPGVGREYHSSVAKNSGLGYTEQTVYLPSDRATGEIQFSTTSLIVQPA